MIEYKHYFETLLNESPDEIHYKDIMYTWRRGKSSQILYDDLVTNQKEWVVAIVDTGIIKASDPKIMKELGYFYNLTPLEDMEEVIQRIEKSDNKLNRNERITLEMKKNGFVSMYGSGSSPIKYVHPALLYCLVELTRIASTKASRRYIPLSSRFFDVGGSKILSFWQSKNRVQEYKDIIIRWLHEIGENDTRGVLYQAAGWEDDKFEDYDTFFEEPAKAASLADKKRAELAAKAHMMQLPPGWKEMMLKALREYKEEMKELFDKPVSLN